MDDWSSPRAKALIALLNGLGENEGALPQSVLKSMREARGLKQSELARLTGVGQQTISSVESGTSQLTLKTAERLAPVLGRDVDAAELCAFEDVARMRRLALKGAISPEQVLAVIQNLIAAAAEEDEESAREIDGELTRALLSVLRLALRTYDGSSAVASVSSAATKSARPDGTRDSYGRRTSKPFAPANAEALPGGGVPAPEAALKSRTATRDRDGRRIDKPFAPRGR